MIEYFIQILSQHRGLAQAISVADMAERLGLGREKAGQRHAQAIKRAVVEQGHLVGSSCGSTHGWYLPINEDEVRATCSQYKARIRSLAQLIRQTEGAAGFQAFVGQLQMEFEEVIVGLD